MGLSTEQKNKAISLLLVRQEFQKKGKGKVTLEFICSQVVNKKGENPTKSCMSRIAASLDKKGPKKREKKPMGRPPKFSVADKKRVAKSAMVVKRLGAEPSSTRVKLQAPKATKNMSDRTIQRCVTTYAYDVDPEHPWKFQSPLSRVGIPPEIQGAREKWCADLRARPEFTPGRVFRNYIFFDPCHSILHGLATKNQVAEADRAKTKRKRMISDNAKHNSRNLVGSKYYSQKSFWDLRVEWWICVSRGVLGVLFPPKPGIASFVEELNKWCEEVFPGEPRPVTLVSDRGAPMFSIPGWSTYAYREACEDYGFRIFVGNDARSQPSMCADLLLHETCVPWIRDVLAKKFKQKKTTRGTTFVRETLRSFKNRMAKTVAHINENFDVDSLSRGFPGRVEKCYALEGDHIGK